MAVKFASLLLKAMFTEHLPRKVELSELFGSSFDSSLFGHLVFASFRRAYLLGSFRAAAGRGSCATNLGSYLVSVLSDSHQTVCGDCIACYRSIATLFYRRNRPATLLSVVFGKLSMRLLTAS
jgi:hypothetical protein